MEDKSCERQGMNHTDHAAKNACAGLDATLVQRVQEAANQTGDLRASVVIALLATALLRPTDVPRLQIEHLVWDGPEVVIQGPGTARSGRPVRLSPHDSALLADYLAERMDADGTMPDRGPLLVGGRTPAGNAERIPPGSAAGGPRAARRDVRPVSNT
jgi:integrase